MNKFLLAIYAIFIFSFLVSGVYAKDVAYVVKTAQNPQIISLLNEMGYSYDVFTDSQVSNANFSNYSVLIIQDMITNKDYLPLSKNLIFINKDYAPLIWTQGTVIAGSSNIFSASLDQLGTPFTQGMSSITFNAYTTPRPEYYLHVYPAGINSVARSTGAGGSYPIIAYSNINNNRKVFFGFYSIDYWSADTKKLFKNSLNWTRLGVDGDGDGYYSDSDCNDNDANRWRNLGGYLDSDVDGYGIGSLLQVCSGTQLAYGYSNVSSDCNDNDKNKWRNLPGYLDSDSDTIGGGSLLQICSGNNLPSGYSASGGDCNDNNASLYVLLNGYLDNDKDGRGSGNVTKVCSGTELPNGYSNVGSDCNDGDASIWRLIPGYLDSDGDGYGFGNSTEVCSGFNLAPGFSNNAHDCNDSNPNINPGALEIPYDGIDETCNGYDLADVDRDGYCAKGYEIMNASLQCSKENGFTGTDCNDNDASYNPDANSSLKDCRNEPPVLNPVNNIRVRETEVAKIILNATDVDDDNLTYFVDDSRFEQDVNQLNVFTWNTYYADEGIYLFEVGVSDGEFEVFRNVSVEILRSNRKPVCNEMPSFNLNEDESMAIDLNEYCYDPDGDNLTYIFSGANANIVESISNGVANISGKGDYYGNEIVYFNVSDGIDSLEINASLEIAGINDAPEFTGNINTIEFNEGSNLTNSFNLNNYFKDVDSNISFNFTGNYNIDVKLHNGYVSFYPKDGWFGSESIVFFASDEEFNIYSNPVIVNVKDINVAPVFSDLDCNLNINEDTYYQCELSASDVENDSFSFSVVGNSRANCSMEGSNLRYISQKDQTGKALCTVRVTDARNASNDKTIEFNISNVNDAPSIKDFYPRENSIRILNNIEKKFTVFSSDIDSEVNTVWKLNDVVVGNLSSYSFIKTNGTYVLSAIVSDGEYEMNHSWNIFVGNVQDFTCSEMNGHICNENQTCTGQLFNVYDTNACCNVACSAKPPQFKNIRNVTVENKSNLVIINTIRPESSDKKYLGDEINATLKLENNLGQDADFDLQIYIYDTTKEKIVNKISQDVKVNDGSSKNVNFTYTLEEDLNEDDTYYIFVRAIGKAEDKSKFYNEIYEKLNVERKDSDIFIKDFVLNQEFGIVCGDEISGKVLVENLGKNSEYIKVRVENAQLDWKIVSDSFRVGGYKEEADQTISLTIPDNAKDGIYKIKVSFDNYNNNQVFEKEITLDKCANQITSQQSIETIRLNPSTEEAISSNEDNGSRNIIVGIISLIFMIAILIALLYVKKGDFVDNNQYNEFGILDVTPMDNKIAVKKVKKSKN